VDWYQVNLVVHLLAAAVWTGGLLFIAAVLVPVSRSVPPPWGGHLVSLAGRRFRYVSWPALAVLVLTGLENARHWDVLPDRVQNGSLFDDRFGTLLTVKAGLVVGMLALSFLHDFVLGPRLSRLLEQVTSEGKEATEARVKTTRRRTVWLARINLAATIAIMTLAVVMLR
jgi:putative copper export protein